MQSNFSEQLYQIKMSTFIMTPFGNDLTISKEEFWALSM